MAVDTAGKIKAIFCDSKAGKCFSVVLRDWNVDQAQAVGAQVEAALFSLCLGHNGIWVSCGPDMFGKPSIYLDPNWGDGH